MYHEMVRFAFNNWLNSILILPILLRQHHLHHQISWYPRQSRPLSLSSPHFGTPDSS